MKGVILAGGTGSRLGPLTAVTNKHLLPVFDAPMICHGVRILRQAGIRRLLVVTGPEHLAAFRRVLGTSVAYAVQPRPAGIADALRHAEDFVAGQPFVALLGDNLFGGPLNLTPPATGACLFLKRVADPRPYGVAEFVGQRLARIVEKPRRPTSRQVVVGLYLLDARVFDLVRALRPSRRGELEIADVLNAYLAAGALEHRPLRGWWRDAGASPAALLAAGQRVARDRQGRA